MSTNTINITKDVNVSLFLNGGTVTLDSKQAGKINRTITANTILTITNHKAGDEFFVITQQDATGGRVLTLTTYGDALIDPTANARTSLHLISDGTNIRIVANSRYAWIAPVIPATPGLQAVTNVQNVTTNPVLVNRPWVWNSQLFGWIMVTTQPSSNLASKVENDEMSVENLLTWFKTVFQFPNPTQNNTATLQNASGTLAFIADIPTWLPPTGTAGWDLTGTYPNPWTTNISVISKLLTWLSLLTGWVISATDSILIAFWKLQNQITAFVSSKQDALSGTWIVRSFLWVISYINGTSSQFVKWDGSLDSNTYLTGNQNISLTSDVVWTGSTNITTTIQPNVVTNTKLAQMPAKTVKANDTNATANPQDIPMQEIILGKATLIAGQYTFLDSRLTTNSYCAGSCFLFWPGNTALNLRYTPANWSMLLTNDDITSTDTFGFTIVI